GQVPQAGGEDQGVLHGLGGALPAGAGHGVGGVSHDRHPSSAPVGQGGHVVGAHGTEVFGSGGLQNRGDVREVVGEQVQDVLLPVVVAAGGDLLAAEFGVHEVGEPVDLAGGRGLVA